MTAVVTPCPDCGAYRPATVCPVCQQFDPPVRRSALFGVALLGGVAGVLAAAGWTAGLLWKWDRWRGQFGDTAEPAVEADARAAAVAFGLLLFAAAGVGTAAAVAWVGRR